MNVHKRIMQTTPRSFDIYEKIIGKEMIQDVKHKFTVMRLKLI